MFQRCLFDSLRYMESGTRIFLRDLEPSRNSIMKPGHTFMGMVQVSRYQRPDEV